MQEKSKNVRKTLLSAFVGSALKGQNKLSKERAVLECIFRIEQLTPALTGAIDHCKRGSRDFSGAGCVTRPLAATATFRTYRGFLTCLHLTPVRVRHPFATIASGILVRLYGRSVTSTSVATATAVQFTAQHTAQKIGVGTVLHRATVVFHIHL